MWATCSSESLVSINKATLRHNEEERIKVYFCSPSFLFLTNRVTQVISKTLSASMFQNVPQNYSLLGSPRRAVWWRVLLFYAEGGRSIFIRNIGMVFLMVLFDDAHIC